MKKIVALVLAMVMVLGLATTAFAAKGGVSFDDALAQGTKWDVKVEAADAADEKDFAFPTFNLVATPKDDGVQMFWETATATDTEKGEPEDVELAGEEDFVKVVGYFYDTNVIVVVDGKTITTYAVAETVNETLKGWDAKAVKVTFPVKPTDNGDIKCNTLYQTNPAAAYYFYDDTLYGVATTAAYDMILNVDGVAVFAVELDWEKNEGGLWFNDHDYEIETSTLTHGMKPGTLVKAYCQSCKAEFVAAYTQGAKATATAIFGDGNYELVANLSDANAAGNYHMALLMPENWPTAAAVVPGTPAVDGDKVESPKTFDAGIAMYVGMSVMAAAGSAVVLKKKD